MQQGGSQYGVPPSEMTPTFAVSGTGPRPHMLRIPTSDRLQQPPAEAASPISSRPPAPAAGARPSNIDELAPAMAAAGNYAEDTDAIAAGEEAERGVAGNRWPRQETLALLKIRSDMDATFRDATLKGPLWDEVSRKLAELGYTRSAKKCKEKFENVHKYYKRTKEKCGGRQDGKSYRFFSQLEALNNSTSSATASLPSQTASAFGSCMAGRAQPTPLTSIAPSSSNQPPPPPATDPVPGVTPPAGLFSFSTNTSSSSSSSDSDGEDTEEGVATESGQRKRKRSSSSGGSRKMRNFFKGLMQQVLERQEAMQKKFLETIEKREQDRMIREEAWKRQEMARLSREHELNAQERAMSATRDNSIIAFLQKITGQSIPVPQLPVSMTIVSPTQPAVTAASPPPPPPPPPPQQQPPTLQHKQQQAPVPSPTRQRTETITPRPPPPPPRTTTSSSEPVVTTARDQTQEFGSAGGSTDPASSRWPKTEVHALIKIRSEMEPRYQEAGPKGPLWEEISAGMRRLGYNRSSKRCKEKWENINKYFKKVKESSKKRPDDSKTCPYFHQLDALYRKKVLSGAGGISGAGTISGGQQESHEQINPEVLPITTLPPPTTNTQGGTSGDGNGGNSAACVASATNGGHSPTFLEEGAGTSATGGDIKKPEDIVKELMERDYNNAEENGSDGIGVDDEDEDEEQQKMAYKIEFQRPNVGGTTNNGGNPSVPATTTTTTTAASSFLAMVK